MSNTLYIYDQIAAICEAAGLDPGSVGSMTIGPDSVTFTVYDQPLRMGPNREPVQLAITHPWRIEP